jgi:DNA invertase Pin-like site-specific DNA recombinase
MPQTKKKRRKKRHQKKHRFLTDTEREEIRRRYSAGESCRTLARVFDCSPTTIETIVEKRDLPALFKELVALREENAALRAVLESAGVA